jgi:predicted 3-demethylubiquinone-9 3-methyltransferase (glyoxalase superfamily)
VVLLAPIARNPLRRCLGGTDPEIHPWARGDSYMTRLPAFTLIILAGCSGEQMATSVSTHLMFQGAADEAIALYRSVFPEFLVDRQEIHDDGDMMGKVRLAHVKFGDHRLIIFDSPAVHNFTFTPSMSLFVEFDDADRLRQAFEVLSEDGEVPMPLGDYGFSPLFGWLQDRYGVSWQLNLKGDEGS